MAEIKQLKIFSFCPLHLLKFFLPNEKLEFKFRSHNSGFKNELLSPDLLKKVSGIHGLLQG
jgi:hypothetical protein